MIFLIVVIFALVGAVLYVAIGTSGTATPAAVKVAELARLTFGAAMFALMFALAMGYLHDVLVKVVR